MNFARAIATFTLSARADGMTDKTLRWYVWLLQASPHAPLVWLERGGRTALQQVTTNDLRAYIVWLRAQPNTRSGALQSPETIAGYIRALHRFFSWCAVEYTLPDPMARIAYPKTTEQRPKGIDLHDMAAMFEAAGTGPLGARNRALLAFLIDTGCRAAGLCGLQVGQMDSERQRALVVEKGDKARMVVWTARTGELLQAWDAYRAPTGSFFYNIRTERPLTVAGLRIILHKIAVRAGVTSRVNPHAFRHAFAREYILNGGDLATLSRLLGHRQVSTTVGYYAIFTNEEIAQRHALFSPMSKLEV